MHFFIGSVGRHVTVDNETVGFNLEILDRIAFLRVSITPPESNTPPALLPYPVPHNNLAPSVVKGFHAELVATGTYFT